MHFSAVYRIDYVDILWRSAARGVKQWSGGKKNKLFSSYKYVNISKTVRDTSKVTISG